MTAGKKVRRGPKRSLSVNEDSDGPDVSLGEFGDDFDMKAAKSFLGVNLGATGNNAKRTKKTVKEEDLVEATSRKWSQKVENDEGHLMIRDKSGKWVAPKIASKAQVGTEEVDESDPEEVPDAQSTPAESSYPKKSMKEWSADLAKLATAITLNPEENVQKLRSLPSYYKCKDKQRRTLGMASTVAIFKDILPGYQIRELSEAEKAVQVSKDVAKSRNYDQTLLASYTEFFRHCKSEFSDHSDPVAFKCLCELGKSAQSFNHADVIISVVAAASVANGNAQVRIAGGKALASIFLNDGVGRLTMLALKAMSNTLREKKFEILNSELIVALGNVKLQTQPTIISRTESTVAPEADKKVQSHLSKKQRKEAKIAKKDSRKKAVEEAAEEQKKRNKWARDTRDHLFAIIFGYIKFHPKGPLMPQVLSVIGKFSPFLGVEYFADLTNQLKGMATLKDASEQLCLQAILAVFKISENQEAASGFDLRVFFCVFYRLLAPERIQQLVGHEGDVEAVFKMLFLRKRSLPKERLGSFAHRMAASALSRSLAIGWRRLFMRLLKELLIAYPYLNTLIEDEPMDNGTFLEACDDPDIARPFCKRLDVGGRHEDPELGALAQSIMQRAKKHNN